jgi:hypothetical protein
MSMKSLQVARTLLAALVAAVTVMSGANAVVSLVATTDTLPLAIVVGTPYSGNFACFNDGSESIANVTCTASGLPSWAVVGTCTPPTPVASLSAPPTGLIRIVGSITCPVTGTPTSAGSFSLTITGSGTGVTSIRQANLRVFAVPTELTASIDLPPAIIGQRWVGTFTCDSVGTVAPADRTCTVTELPPWVTRLCLPLGTNGVLCILSGTPTASGASQITVATTASNASGVSVTGTLTVSALVVPTLSAPMLALLLLGVAFFAYRADRRSPR